MNIVAEEKQWDAFLQDGLPTRKDERWKYTDLTPLTAKKFVTSKPIDADVFSDAIHQHRLQDEMSVMLVFVNGQFQETLSDLAKLPAGLIACTIQVALQEHAELMAQNIIQPIDAKLYPFAKLNATLSTGGLFLYLPPHYDMKMPIHLLSISTSSEQFVAHPQLIMILGDNSKVVMAEEHYGMTNAAYFMNLVTHIHVGKDAQLEHYKMQREGKHAIHMANTFVHQEQNSRAEFMNISIGAEFARDDLVIKLKEQGAECHTSGFYHLRADNQYVDNHIDIDHIAPRTNSEMLYKGILENKSRAVFNGRLYVEKDAQKILAYQANHNLLLSNEAEVYSKPELEIYADDVKCKHGASTGQIDQDAIFYLRSRGISFEDARSMLLEGFADDVLQRITNKGIKMRALELL